MKIYVTADVSDEAIKLLKILGHEVRTGGWGQTEILMDEDDFIKEIGDAEILMVGYEHVTKKVIDNTNLKAVSCTRGGPRASIDVDYCTQKGIPVFQTFGREADPVADFTIGQIISLARLITRTDRELRNGIFTAPDKDYGTEGDVIWDMGHDGPWQARKGVVFEGKTHGLIGLGTVGQQVSRRSASFGMRVISYDPYQRDEVYKQCGVEKVTLEELCKQSDIISIHAKVDESNKGQLDENYFDMMRQGVYFINNARAGIVKEEAQRQALRSGKLGGLALDVFHAEPIKENDEYFEYDNVIVTPHIAGSGFEALYLQAIMVVNDVLFYLGGGIPKTTVNKEVFNIK